MASLGQTPNVEQPDSRFPPVRAASLCNPWFVATAWLVTCMVAVGLFVIGGVPHTLRGTSASTRHTVEEPTPAGIILRQLRHLDGKDAAQGLLLHSSLGHIYRDEGHYSAAGRHYEAALELEAPGGDRILLQRMLGLVRFQEGRLSDARRQLEGALTLTNKHGEDAVQVLHVLGDVRKEMGHLRDALQLYNEAWELGSGQCTTCAGHLPLLAADIGETHTRQGATDQAFSWFHRATESQGKARRMQPPAVEKQHAAKIHSMLASTYHMRGAVVSALELYRKALEVQTHALRPSHPDLASTRIGMARAQRDLGDHLSAMQTIESLEQTLRSGPQEGSDLSQALILKAEFMREAEQYADAASAAQEALQLLEACCGDEVNPALAAGLNVYSSILHDEGKFKDALEMYKRALDINMQTVGPHHPETAATHNNLGTFYEDVGQDDKAREHYFSSLEIQLHSVGEASPDVANTYNNLATILFRQGAHEEAEQLFQKALQVMANAGLPKDNPDRAVYEKNLFDLRKAMDEQGADGEPQTVAV